MTHKLPFIILGYTALQLALSLWLQSTAPVDAKISIMTGVAAALVCGLWSAFSLKGHPSRAWLILTLGIAAFLLLSQTVTFWINPGESDAPGRRTAILSTLMFVLTIALLMIVTNTASKSPETRG
ncbi:MAG: hypothetical protein AB1813_17850 [Verrucomicrobiota bacterium]